eukprot:1160092-Pelagomonas_calceolata.AAC.2
MGALSLGGRPDSRASSSPTAVCCSRHAAAACLYGWRFGGAIKAQQLPDAAFEVAVALVAASTSCCLWTAAYSSAADSWCPFVAVAALLFLLQPSSPRRQAQLRNPSLFFPAL